jgi:ABC-type spermidine/putrescine transport system permease subunit I
MMDSFMRAISQGVTIGYYAVTLVFALALAWNLWKSRKPYDSVLYVIILIPFVLRLLRLK